MSRRKFPELLAPAGSPEAAKAALKAGADAVYIGGRMLNARMNARNFTDEELAGCVKLCHGRGVRLYVALNTAVYDRELSEAVEYADWLYSVGVDALIVSDIGFARAVCGRYPGMELHASTQASGHNSDCAEALAGAGFSRMVCARELSGKEIKDLCEKSPIEIEQFIHGAMCVSQSGQCLASLVMGGRSGNRGVCAQPCRMKYNGGYPLSLKDMCLAGHITGILESGVGSLKIEGRMKSPEYVYETVSVYRRLLDEARNASETEYRALAAVFSRSGFTDGYYTGKTDSGMNGIRTGKDISATSAVRTDFTDRGRRLPPINVTRKPMTDAAMTAVKRNAYISNTSAPANTAYMPNSAATANVPNAVKMPDSAKAAGTTFGFVPPKPPKVGSFRGKPIYTARFSGPEQICGREMFSHIYLPLEKYEAGICDGVVFPPAVFQGETDRFLRDVERAAKLGATDALVCHAGQIKTAVRFGLVPHGDFRLNVFNSFAARYYTVDALGTAGAGGVNGTSAPCTVGTVRVSDPADTVNIGIPDAVSDKTGTADGIHTSGVFNTADSVSVSGALDTGVTSVGAIEPGSADNETEPEYPAVKLRDVILSPELTLPQIRDINAPKSVIVYGRLPIMLLAKPVGYASLSDRTGAVFPIIKEYGFDVLLNSVPVYMADKQKELDMYGVRGRHFVFTVETPAQCAEILHKYMNSVPPAFPVRRISK